jgi:excisionase family DNA binding protein
MHIEKGVPVTFKIHEVAKILNCSRSQVYVLIKTGELESVLIRGSRRVTEDQLVRYIKKLEGSSSLDNDGQLSDN